MPPLHNSSAIGPYTEVFDKSEFEPQNDTGQYPMAQRILPAVVRNGRPHCGPINRNLQEFNKGPKTSNSHSSAYRGTVGSDGSAAGGGYSDLSEWQRSVSDAGDSPRRAPGTATVELRSKSKPLRSKLFCTVVDFTLLPSSNLSKMRKAQIVNRGFDGLDLF